jgi:hypothetical protein
VRLWHRFADQIARIVALGQAALSSTDVERH